MDGSSFEACMGSPETKARVEADLKLGSDVGLKGTPLLVINGRLVSGAVSEERLKAAVRYEIRRAQGFGG
jgi:protein-disulfide isomerase